MLNGKLQNLNSGIIVVKGRTMLPLREIASLLGAEVNYNEDLNKPTLQKRVGSIQSHEKTHFPRRGLHQD